MALDFHYHPDVQDNQDNQDIQGVQYIDDIPPPYAPPLQRAEHWEPEIPRMRVSELKTRLSAALNRTNTPLTFNEKRDLRVALDDVSKPHVRMDDEYDIPDILSRVESIPFRAKRGIRGNGGSRRCRNKKRTLRKKKRTLRKKKRTLSKRTLKKRSF